MGRDAGGDQGNQGGMMYSGDTTHDRTAAADRFAAEAMREAQQMKAELSDVRGAFEVYKHEADKVLAERDELARKLADIQDARVRCQLRFQEAISISLIAHAQTTAARDSRRRLVALVRCLNGIIYAGRESDADLRAAVHALTRENGELTRALNALRASIEANAAAQGDGDEDRRGWA